MRTETLHPGAILFVRIVIMQLKAMVIGSGWAAEGHCVALRTAGVEVAALCGRSPVPTQALAQKLGIPAVRVEWRSAIQELRPDIVAIATPAGPHADVAVAAAELGCNVFCEKPLGVDAAAARTMLTAAVGAGVKHAYGATSCLSPAIALVRDLLADGRIGTLASLETSAHFGVSFPFAHSWFHELSQGGGMLNNLFTHKLAQVLRLTGGTPAHVAGEARSFINRAPVAPPIHDFRELFRPITDVDETDPTRWRPADADTVYAVILELALPTGGEVTARFDASLTSKSREDETLTLCGTKGTFVLTGGNSPSQVHHYDFKRDNWEQLSVSQSGDETEARVEDAVQRDWNTLVRQFAADIRGETHGFYPTFEDGWLAAEIIDIVRAGRARSPIPLRP